MIKALLLQHEVWTILRLEDEIEVQVKEIDLYNDILLESNILVFVCKIV